MAETVIVGWERALMAAEKVKERLRRATRALDGAGVPYAVVGGNAVAEWVARVDDEAVRNTRDVDLLVRRTDFAATRAALEAAGFVCHHLMDVDVFIDGHPALAETGFTTRFEPFEPQPAAKACLKPGAPVRVAIHTHQDLGGQCIDLGIVSLK